MEDRCSLHLGLDPLDDKGEHLHGPAAPIQKRAVGDIGGDVPGGGVAYGGHRVFR